MSPVAGAGQSGLNASILRLGVERTTLFVNASTAFAKSSDVLVTKKLAVPSYAGTVRNPATDSQAKGPIADYESYASAKQTPGQHLPPSGLRHRSRRC